MLPTPWRCVRLLFNQALPSVLPSCQGVKSMYCHASHTATEVKELFNASVRWLHINPHLVLPAALNRSA